MILRHGRYFKLRGGSTFVYTETHTIRRRPLETGRHVIIFPCLYNSDLTISDFICEDPLTSVYVCSFIFVPLPLFVHRFYCLCLVHR